MSDNIALVGARGNDNQRGSAYLFNVTTGNLLHTLTGAGQTCQFIRTILGRVGKARIFLVSFKGFSGFAHPTV